MQSASSTIWTDVSDSVSSGDDRYIKACILLTRDVSVFVVNILSKNGKNTSWTFTILFALFINFYLDFFKELFLNKMRWRTYWHYTRVFANQFCESDSL